jgi:hypothetical protein
MPGLAKQHVFLLALALAVVAGNAAAGPSRCEDRNGAVTYVDGDCPAGSRVVRTLGAEPAPSEQDSAAAKRRATEDQQKLKVIESARAREDREAERAARLAAREAERNAAACRVKALQVQHAREDLAKANAARRSAYETRLRRAEELHAAECGASSSGSGRR